MSDGEQEETRKWIKLEGKKHQVLYLLAAFIERDEWEYVSPDSMVEAVKALSSGDDIVVVEEDELGDTIIVRLPEEGD